MKCNYCGREAEPATGAEVYPHRPDLHHKTFLVCRPCDARVGCHPNGEPFGRLANKALRVARMYTHEAFDALWQDGPWRRNEAYAALAKAMGIPRQSCHIGQFTEEECERATTAVGLISVQSPKEDDEQH